MAQRAQVQRAPNLIPSDKAPVHTIRHRSLKASIWKNETKKGMMYKVTVVRSYKEGDEWHDTHSFAFDELMNVAKLFSDAQTWISQERRSRDVREMTTDSAIVAESIVTKKSTDAWLFLISSFSIR